MGQDIVCPVLKADGGEKEEEKTSEVVTEFTPDEGVLQIGSFKMTGFRTYSVVLLIMATYCYLALKTNTVDAMKDLALMAAGFIFGLKSIKR